MSSLGIRYFPNEHCASPGYLTRPGQLALRGVCGEAYPRREPRLVATLHLQYVLQLAA